MSGTNGRIALASNNIRVEGVTASNVLDFVGFGSSALFEGTGATPVLSTVLSAQRKALVDTNDNAADFEAKTPTPQNTSSLAVSDVTKSKSSLVKNTSVESTLVFAKTADVKIYNVNGQLVKSASVKENSTLDISSLPKGVYIVNGDGASQKVIKK